MRICFCLSVKTHSPVFVFSFERMKTCVAARGAVFFCAQLRLRTFYDWGKYQVITLRPVKALCSIRKRKKPNPESAFDRAIMNRVPKYLFWCRKTAYNHLINVLYRFEGYIKNLDDLFGERAASAFFLIFGKKMSAQLKTDTKAWIASEKLCFHKKINSLIRKTAWLFMSNQQIIEESNDTKVIGSEPVIWIANHRFKDDAAATIRAAGRYAYVFFGSMPMFFNTFQGIMLWANGLILCNRKVKASRKAAMEKAIEVLKSGTDVILFPEGVWNKTQEKLLLPFFPGVYKIAKASGAKVVPIIHYLPSLPEKKKGNKIHTIIDKPITINQMEEKEALTKLRDIMATRYFELMERFGTSTREKELGAEVRSTDEWDRMIKEHAGKVPFYDKEVELCGDYCSNTIIRPETVWKQIADIKEPKTQSVGHVLFARKVVEEERERNFQRRY